MHSHRHSYEISGKLVLSQQIIELLAINFYNLYMQILWNLHEISENFLVIQQIILPLAINYCDVRKHVLGE